MTVELTPEQVEFRRAVRRFSRDEIVLAGPGRREAFPSEVVRRMGELGLFGLPFPSTFGGLDGDLLTFCVCLEEIASVDPGAARTLGAAVSLGANAVFRLGSDEQRQRWLAPIARGLAIAALALGEPDDGPDSLARLGFSARRAGAGWVLEGSISSVVNADTPLTSVFVVPAVTPEGTGAFLVPADAPGLSVGSAVGGAVGREVVVLGCHVAADQVLGEPGRVDEDLLEVLDDGVIAATAIVVGQVGGRLAADALRHSGGSEGLRAELREAEGSARDAYLRAARLRDHRRPYRTATSVARTHADGLAVSARDLGFRGADAGDRPQGGAENRRGGC